MRHVREPSTSAFSTATYIVMACVWLAMSYLPFDKHGTPLEVTILAVESLCLVVLVMSRRWILVSFAVVLMLATFYRL